MNKNKVKNILNSRSRSIKNKSVYKKHLHKANRNKNNRLLKSLLIDSDQDIIFEDNSFDRDYNDYNYSNFAYETYSKWFKANVNKERMVENFGYTSDPIPNFKGSPQENDFITNQNLNGLLCHLVPKHKRYLFKRIATLNSFVHYRSHKDITYSCYNSAYFKDILCQIAQDSEAHRTLNNLIKTFWFTDYYHKVIPIYRFEKNIIRLFLGYKDIESFWLYVTNNYKNSHLNHDKTIFHNPNEFAHPEYYDVVRWFLHNYYINNYQLNFLNSYFGIFRQTFAWENIRAKQKLIVEIIRFSIKTPRKKDEL